ncbi:hypothetical protein GGF40_002188 [Coemansia sp. RSA 1286]|nr:hypothetical protein GGF40_002188 [Coemansia sp. RSA 1286]
MLFTSWLPPSGPGTGPLKKALTIAALALLASVCSATDAPAPVDACGPSSRYVVAYYNTWKRQSLMNIDWSKITHLNVAHAIPSDSGDFTFDGEWFLPQLVQEAHTQKTKILLSLGGWTGSNRFSALMRDPHKRAALIRAISVFVEKHELDGVDLDWEYVGRAGSKCNKFSAAEDAPNLLRFLRALRASFHARFPQMEKIISMAVGVQPFTGVDGPMTDVSMFAEYVDYAQLLAFDVNGPWSNTTGPNAPLIHQRNRGAPYSLTQAVDQWTAANWPSSKLIAGISFLGRSLTTSTVMVAKPHAQMYTAFDRDIPQGDPEDARWYDVCENTNQMSGIWQYRHLRDQGILKTSNGTNEEWIRVWDDMSQTPWLYNPQMRRFVSYDDQESVGKKVQLAKEKGLKGVGAWGMHADFNGELVGVLDQVGPLCRGNKSDNDPAPSSSVSSSSSSSSSSSWSPTAPMAFLPSHAQSTSSAASSTMSASSTASEPSTSASSSSSSPSSSSSSSSSSSTEPVTKPTETPTSLLAQQESASTSPATESPTPSASQASDQQQTTTSSAKKAILFNDVGAPYMVVDGSTSMVPSDLAAKLMQMGETPTDTSSIGSSVTDDALPLGPVAIPVVDGASSTDKLQHNTELHTTMPLWQQYNHQTNLFDSSSSAELHGPMYAPSSTSSTMGFAATFFLTLDPSSTGASGSTTVVPLAQMMASASDAANSSISATTSMGVSSLDPLASPSAVSNGSSSMSPSPFI